MWYLDTPRATRAHSAIALSRGISNLGISIFHQLEEVAMMPPGHHSDDPCVLLADDCTNLVHPTAGLSFDGVNVRRYAVRYMRAPSRAL